VLHFTAQVTPASSGIQSIATYNANFGDNFNEPYTMPTYCASINAQPGASPNITKPPLNQSVNANSTITWSILSANNGTLALNNAVVTDTLPAGLTFLSAIPAASSVTGGGANPTIITWQLGSIAAGGSVTLQLNATAPPATTASYENDVQLSGIDTNQNSYLVTASANVNVNDRPPTVTVTSPSPCLDLRRYQHYLDGFRSRW
jgi:uncharacterized repeat protein (TIGR01451 family)